MLELTQCLDAADVAYLPIRLDRQTPQNNSQDFGDCLGLPESPVACLRAVARDRPSVLILDQLDALRWTSQHSLEAIGICQTLVREIRGHRALGHVIDPDCWIFGFILFRISHERAFRAHDHDSHRVCIGSGLFVPAAITYETG